MKKSLFKYSAADKMSEIICDNASLLLVIRRFGISLGFGDDSVQQVCTRQGVHLETFLAVINFLSDPANTTAELHDSVSGEALLGYLEKSHIYFLDSALPNIRKKLIEIIGDGNSISQLVLKFYDDYISEIRKHMEYEEQLVFPFVKELLEGRHRGNFKISTFSQNHKPVDEKLTELKNIIIKYFQVHERNNNLLNAVLFEIFSLEQELKEHCRIEDQLFVPYVMNLEKELVHPNRIASAVEDDSKSLSEREKEIVIYAVKGLTNKEIAEKLHLSAHTVITHRRNISRKLQIHSVAALTIYAIANKLIDLKELD